MDEVLEHRICKYRNLYVWQGKFYYVSNGTPVAQLGTMLLQRCTCMTLAAFLACTVSALRSHCRADGSSPLQMARTYAPRSHACVQGV